MATSTVSLELPLPRQWELTQCRSFVVPNAYFSDITLCCHRYSDVVMLWLQVQGNGLGFKHLVSLTANPSVRCLVLKCICNLCYSSSCRPALGSVGVVEIILEELFHHQEDITGNASIGFPAGPGTLSRLQRNE
jgi:hypothetical protein